MDVAHTAEQFDDRYDPGQGQASLLRIAWQRKSLIAFGVVLGAILGCLYYVQRTPVYQAGVQMLVVKKRADALPLTGSGESPFSMFDDYLATHMVLLRSPVIVGKAVKSEKYNLAGLSTFAGQKDPTGSII